MAQRKNSLIAQSCRNRSAGVIRLEISNCPISSSASRPAHRAGSSRASAAAVDDRADGTQAEIGKRLADVVRSLWVDGHGRLHADGRYRTEGSYPLSLYANPDDPSIED